MHFLSGRHREAQWEPELPCCRRLCGMGFPAVCFPMKRGWEQAESVPLRRRRTIGAQGYYSMTGVFVDTMVICLVTGLAVGVTGAAERAAEAEKADGAAMVIRAFESVFGPAGGYLVTIGILLFAFATMAGWAYQGEQAFVWLVKKESFGMVYRVFFCFAASAGCVCVAEIVWNFAELANACMAVPT